MERASALTSLRAFLTLGLTCISPMSMSSFSRIVVSGELISWFAAMAVLVTAASRCDFMCLVMSMALWMAWELTSAMVRRSRPFWLTSSGPMLSFRSTSRAPMVLPSTFRAAKTMPVARGKIPFVRSSSSLVALAKPALVWGDSPSMNASMTMMRRLLSRIRHLAFLASRMVRVCDAMVFVISESFMDAWRLLLIWLRLESSSVLRSRAIFFCSRSRLSLPSWALADCRTSK